MNATTTETDRQPATLREKMRLEKKARLERYAGFEILYAKALEAGRAAGNAIRPTPMVVTERSNPLDDSSPVRQQWYESEGACGFAWVNVTPGTSSFARWLVKKGYASAAYGGGVDIWISDYNQSVDRKDAHATAMARVFKEAGITAYGCSRLD